MPSEAPSGRDGPHEWRTYVRAHLRPLRVAAERENEIVEELAQQLESAYEAARADGCNDSDATARAAAEVPDWNELAHVFEHIESPTPAAPRTTASNHREGPPIMSDFLQDIRYAARALMRTRGYTATAVLTLGLGLGLAAVAVAVIDAILVRPLPYPGSDELVLMKATVPPEGRHTAEITYPDAQDIAKLEVFDGVAAFVAFAATTTITDPPSRAEGFLVSPSLFDVLGVTASRGRLLSVRDESPDSPPVVVIGHGFWQRLGSPADIVGKTLPIDDVPRTIVGVAPPGFRLELVALPADVFVPLTPANFGAGNRGLRAFRVVARLKDGISREQATAAAATLGAQLATAYPDTNRDRSFSVWSLHDEIVGPVRSQLWLVAALVALVFLVACVSLAGLLITRTVARMRDVTVRLALGAGWARLGRQSVVEALLLSIVGGLIAIVLASVAIEAIRQTPGLSLPRLGEVHVDARVLGVLAVIITIVSTAVGLLPLLVARSLRDTSALRTGPQTASRPAMRFRALLVASQIAFVFLLLATAALLSSSLRALLAQPLGFDTVHVITMRVATPASRYPTLAATTTFYAELLEGIRSHPTVQSAGLISNLPLAGNTGSTLTIQGREEVPLARRPTVGWHWTSPDYFAAVGMPIVKGRDFTTDDVRRTPHVTVINETLARLYFSGEDPLGKRVYFGGFGPGGPPEWHEVIGVVGDVRHRGLEAEPDPRAYDLFGQHWGRTASLAVRSHEGAVATAGLVRRLVAERDPQLAVFSVRTTADLVNDAVATRRMLFRLVTVFAVVGLIIAAIGLYGTVAYMVLQRTREVGVRVALGATRAEIYRLVIVRGVRIAAAGIAVGVVLTLMSRRLIETQLFGVTATNVAALATAAGALLVAAMAACLVPARRAVRVNPVDALRTE